MRRYLRTVEDAAEILDAFNGFHDGFIERFTVRSHDSFSRAGPEPWDMAHTMTGRFDVSIRFAHYNYQKDGAPLQGPDERVDAILIDVRDVCLDLRTFGPHDWAITSIDIGAAERETDDRAAEPCFTLDATWKHLVEGAWHTRTHRLLTFREARFETVRESD